MRNLYRVLRLIAVAAAALVLIAGASTAYAQTGYTSPYLYFRPGTTVPYYNYFLPRSNFCYVPFGFPGFRGDFITDTRFAGRVNFSPLPLTPRFLEDSVKPAPARKTKPVW